MTRALGLVAAFLLLATPALAETYDYEPVGVWGERAIPVRTVHGAEVRDIDFFSSTGNHVTGEIVRGEGDGPHPAVLFIHWLGAPATTNHTEFEADAAALAKVGVTSLLVDAMWAKPGWIAAVGTDAEADFKATVDQVIDLRGALDVLLAQPDVDKARVALVAHDFGAMVGALLTAVDDRPQTLVLMAGNPYLAEWYRFGKDRPDKEAYAKRIGELDILAGLKASKARAMLFQFSAQDRFIPVANAELLFDAAPEPKGIVWYDTDHALATPQAFKDRQDWLKDRLEVD
jgi:fermentation-respiration switch protein FrsA (DUF1100 family)